MDASNIVFINRYVKPKVALFINIPTPVWGLNLSGLLVGYVYRVQSEAGFCCPTAIVCRLHLADEDAEIMGLNLGVV